ncbi:ras family-domain-containing protein [Phascolomyces articulosus]|uniref:Ras family-domain-containing protein n=1 Tax=Phascolomyces articulosus TaxID=60185 RepID=A0AAD5K5R6_9FUNG|nr:ras family-domain-containing protein [Phascolomyces articulosus]
MYAASRETLEAKVVVLGATEKGVGKTSVVIRYVQKTFSTNSTSTIGASFMTKKLTVDDCQVRLQIWDTAGQERFRAMAPMYYRGAQAAILVYDITSEESFTDMNTWVEELKKAMTDDMVICIVGNKLDLASNQRVVTITKAAEYAGRVLGTECPVYEVSAKEDDGEIEELFLQLTQILVGKKYGHEVTWKQPSSQLLAEEHDLSTKSKSSCC